MNSSLHEIENDIQRLTSQQNQIDDSPMAQNPKLLPYQSNITYRSEQQNQLFKPPSKSNLYVQFRCL